MVFPAINGAWFSRGGLIYIITQLEEHFVWHTVHPNGVTETGIGQFEVAKDQATPTTVAAKWNFHDGVVDSGVGNDSGKIICIEGRVTYIEWEDGDHFSRICHS